MAQKQGISGFIAELRRRRVFRVAAFYGGIAFVMFQIIDSIFEPLHIPEWIGSLIIILLLVGFPVAVGLAWLFDITPEGIVRTEGRSTDKPGTSNRALIAVTIIAVAFGIWGRWGGADRGSSAIRSIVILPLNNNMGGSEEDYFVDGMTEALTNQLAQLPGLKVMSRTSAMLIKSSGKTIPEIAAEWGVDAVVEGSVFRAGEMIRITAQLIDGRTDTHLWSDEYDRELRDILDLHSEVAKAIANEINLKLSPETKARLAEVRPVNPKAYEQYLKGLHHWNKRTQDGFDRALEYFQASIDTDPNYGPAYAGLALTYELQGEYAFMTAEASYPMAISFAEQALRLDPNLAEAHTALAAARLFYQHDWAAAEAGYKKAIALNPGYATAYQWLSEWNAYKGNFEVALSLTEKSMSLDPLSEIMQLNRAINLGFLGRHDEAIAQHQEMEKLYPDIDPQSTWHVRALLQAGRVDEAVDLDLKILRSYADSLNIVSERLRARYEQGGFEDYAAEWITVMRENSWITDYAFMWSVAWRYALAGDIEGTLAAIKVGLEERSYVAINVNIMPEYDFLRDDPRFQAIIREIGLEP